MTDRDFAEVAEKAIEELRTRGWTRGSLGWNEGWVISRRSGPKGGPLVAKDDWCKVCALGAAGAAWFGDPRMGYGYDPSPGKGPTPLDRGYDAFIATLAEVIDRDWATRRHTFGDVDEGPVYESATDVVTMFNDMQAQTEQDVIDVYERLAHASR